jgi:integrase
MARHSKQGHPNGLYVHRASGRWCKVFSGKRYYLCKTEEDEDGSKSYDLFVLRKHEAETGAKIQGLSDDSIKVADIADQWCQRMQDRVNSGERSQRTLDEYIATGQFVIDHFGKARNADSLSPGDFGKLRSKLAERYGINGLNKRIVQVRTMFNFAFEEELIDKPVKYGQSFDQPDAKALRKHRRSDGSKDYTADEIRSMLKESNSTRRAMILLGVNCGLGNSDIADLKTANLDLKKGWLDYPRAKTEVERRCPIWPETIAAITKSMQQRPKSPDGLVFVSVNGQDYRDDQRTGWRVTGEFRQVLKKVAIEDGRGFYGLRRTFQTIAEECGDIVAVRAIMGHADREDDMSARYRQRITDERLQRAVDTVRAWLLPIPSIDGEGK